MSACPRAGQQRNQTESEDQKSEVQNDIAGFYNLDSS